MFINLNKLNQRYNAWPNRIWCGWYNMLNCIFVNVDMNGYNIYMMIRLTRWYRDCSGSFPTARRPCHPASCWDRPICGAGRTTWPWPSRGSSSTGAWSCRKYRTFPWPEGRSDFWGTGDYRPNRCALETGTRPSRSRTSTCLWWRCPTAFCASFAPLFWLLTLSSIISPHFWWVFA